LRPVFQAGHLGLFQRSEKRRKYALYYVAVDSSFVMMPLTNVEAQKAKTLTNSQSSLIQASVSHAMLKSMHSGRSHTMHALMGVKVD